MKRPLVILAGVFLVSAPVLAQEPAPAAGRYQIAPDGDGFVRLDTETGAMSHCGKRDGVWHCDVIAEDRSEVDSRLEALDEEVAGLREKIDRLNDRLAALDERLEESGIAPAEEAPLSKEEKELDRAFNFAERLMQRFFDMIRQWKAEEEPPREI